MVLAGVEAGVVAAAGGGAGGELDLDDLGAEVGEVAAGDRSGPVVRDLDDAQALKGGTDGDRLAATDGWGFACDRAAERVGRFGFRPGVGPAVGAAGHRLAAAVAEVLAVGEVVVGEQPGSVGHEDHRDAERLPFLGDLLHRVGRAPLADDSLDLGEVVAPAEDGLVVRVVREVGALAEDEDVLVDEEVEEVDPAVLRADEVGAGAHEDAALVRPGDGSAPVGAEHGLGGADLDLLAFAGAAGVAEGGERGERDLESGVELRLVAGDAQGLALRVTGNRPVAAEGVVGQLVGGPAGVGTAATVVVGVGDDDGGVGGGEEVEEGVLLEFRQGKVGEDEVEVRGEGGEGSEERFAVEAIVAEFHAVFEVGVDEVAGRPFAGTGVGPAPPGAAGAQVGEESGGVGPGHAAGEIEDAEVEGGGPVGHAGHSTTTGGGEAGRGYPVAMGGLGLRSQWRRKTSGRL